MTKEGPPVRQRSRVGLYGGSFNPPHVAHVLAASYALAVGNFDKLVVLPTYRHPFDKHLADFLHRVRMCRLAMSFLPSVMVSEIEAELPSPSLTLNTVRAIKQQQPSWELSLIIGSDVLREAENWYAFEQVVALAPAFVLGRAGFEGPGLPPVVLPEISSTEVRDLLARGSDPATQDRLRLLVPANVLAYIEEHALYR